MSEFKFATPYWDERETLASGYLLQEPLEKLKLSLRIGDTLLELKELLGAQEYFHRLQDPLKERCLAMDKDLASFFMQLAKDKEIPVATDLFIKIDELLAPLVVRLRYIFNRPRPRYMAMHYKLNLFAQRSIVGDEPSFPCVHTLRALCYTETIGSLFPALYEPYNELCEEVARSRQWMGVQYQSDITAAIQCAAMVCSYKGWIEEFKL